MDHKTKQQIDFGQIISVAGQDILSGPNENAQTKTKGIFSSSTGVSKDILKNKGSIAFNVSDIFNSRKRINTTTTPAFVNDFEFQWRERTFALTFNYRFNQKKKRGGRRPGGGSYGGGRLWRIKKVKL